MTLDPVTLSTTVCLPCGAGAITRGNALEITSCTCPLHSYPVLDSSALNVTCVPCSAYTPACPSSAGELPAPCPRTLGDPTGCQCALAPFSQLNLQQSSSSQCAASCLSGYLLGKPRSPLEGQPSVTGSPLYTNAPTWQLLLPDQVPLPFPLSRDLVLAWRAWPTRATPSPASPPRATPTTPSSRPPTSIIRSTSSLSWRPSPSSTSKTSCPPP